MEGREVCEDVFPAAVVVDGAGWVEGSEGGRLVDFVSRRTANGLDKLTWFGGRDCGCGFCGRRCGSARCSPSSR